MDPTDDDLDELLERASRGESQARQELLKKYRDRLRDMVSIRMDHRLLPRLDASDVVQETYVKAWQNLSDYLQRRPLPFYAWLRQIAWERLIQLHREHVQAQKRSVKRERNLVLQLPHHSSMELARRLVAPTSSPSLRLLRNEMSDRVHAALEHLSSLDREVLVLRHLEQLSMAEIAGLLGRTVGAIKIRHLRALERLRSIMEDESFPPS